MRALIELSARFFAYLGGLALVGVTLMSTWSIAGRSLFGRPVLGDTELVEVAMAFIVTAFMPICQWRGGNIVVDFFTTGASARTRGVLDRVGALLLAATLGLLAWRTWAGAASKLESGDTSMLLQWPEWLTYGSMVPPLALTALIGLYMAATGERGSADDGQVRQ
jgi:TRAP-type C4-dicarboxylate transport system permease small subunit